MKSMFKSLLLACLAAVFFTGCEKDENRVVFEGGTEPVLSANRTGTIPMSYITRFDEAITLSWTNPDYMFNTGVSSQDVNYLIEIDTAGADFSSPNIKRVAISKNLSITFTQSDINDILLNQLALEADHNYSVEMRVIAALGNNNVGRLVSNTLGFAVRTYSIPPKVTPPGTAPDYADGKLFLVGNATPGGWSNPVPVPSQQFARISATLYELTVQLNPGSYLFLPINGFWGAKYGGLGANNTNNPAGDDFKPEGGDMIAPAVSGLYKITVDFQRGKFTVVLQ
jgi:hypothetical protein